MPFSIDKYGNWLRGSLVVAVYLSFFVVQLFCITGPDSAAIVSPICFYKAVQKKAAVNNQQDHIKKTRLNINKRFQPALGDYVPDNCNIPLTFHITGSYTATPEVYLLISFMHAASLRGPPVITA